MAGECLIIGSTGFLGSHLAGILAESGISFDCLNRHPPANPSHTPQQSFAWEEFDSISDDYASVFLTAATVPDDKTQFSFELNAANVIVPYRVAEHFAKSTLIFASSASVYGTPSGLPIKETTSHHHLSAYGYSKLAGEVAIQHHHDWRILRFSSLYGEGMNDSTFIPRILFDAIQRRRITLAGKGERQQNYLHVKDASLMLLCAARSKTSGIFNAVSPRSHSNLEVANLICESFPETKIAFSGTDSSPSFVYDHSKWSQQMPYQPSVSIENGLNSLIQHASQPN